MIHESRWNQSGGGFIGEKLRHPIHDKKEEIQHHGGKVSSRQASDSTSVAQASSDAYSFNQGSIESDNISEFNHGEYISFDIGLSTRADLIELKQRLVGELEEIRRLKDRIDFGEFQPKFPAKLKKVSRTKRSISQSPFENDPKELCQTTVESGVKGIGELMKMCRQVLTKLMEQKNSWIFKNPVDAVASGLQDYHQIIKQPMDLGTVRSNFAKNLYSSPEDFAADVRLTFNNALLFNPVGDDVRKIAQKLIDRFDVFYRPIGEKYRTMTKQLDCIVSDELRDQKKSWNQIPKPELKKKPKSDSLPPTKKREDSPLLKSHIQARPVKPAVVRGNKGKLPKPKAKDPNKRQMSIDEKRKLCIGLQNLPQEKMHQLVQIIRKKHAHMAQEGDEIELDIEAIDVETLWKLDRFVMNSKKVVSKNKRQALMANNSAAAPTASGQDNVVKA